MCRLTPLLIALALAGCVHELAPQDRTMRKIEAAVELPREAYSLTAYRRYYAASRDDPDLIVAVYEHGGRPTRMWLEWHDLPIVLDGGCSVIQLTFRRSTSRIETLRCN